MSGELKLQFDGDLPAMAVDVVSPDLQVVDRLVVRPGGSWKGPIPSEATFLRVHLPSGRSVILSDPGNLERTVSRASIDSTIRAPTARVLTTCPSTASNRLR